VVWVLGRLAACVRAASVCIMALHKDDNFIHGASSHPGWVYSRGISAPRRVFPFLLLLSSRIIIIIIGSSADVVEEGDDLRCDLLCSFHRQPVPAAIDLFKHSIHSSNQKTFVARKFTR
jgi:hypothetical protein